MTFEGHKFRLSNNWFDFIPVSESPIKYLEIGTFYGANLLSVGDNYAKHNLSELYCIDPWIDYDDYPEYKNKQETIYSTFMRNVENSPHKNKIKVNRAFSHQIIPIFPDEFFDIIYIDGNHEPEYVLEDAVYSFRKLKVNGIMIFNDYGWSIECVVEKAVDAFVLLYGKKIQFLQLQDCQFFIKKIS